MIENDPSHDKTGATLNVSPDEDRLAYLLVRLSAVLALGVVFFVCLTPNTPNDFFWQAKTGQIILQTGHIPRTDPFSWTAHGQRWVVQEWLSALLFHVMLRHMPHLWMLLIYKCGLGTLVGGLVLWRAWIRSESWLLSIGAVLLASFALQDWVDMRPQMLTFVILASLLIGLDQYRRGRARFLPYLLPMAFAAWANLHAAAVIGLVLISLWVLGEALASRFFRERAQGSQETTQPLRPLVYGLAISALAIGLNPNGFELYVYPFQVMGHPAEMDQIGEWVSPDFHQVGFRYFELLLLGTFAAMALAGRRRGWSTGDMLMLLVMAHAGLFVRRNVAPFSIAAAPVMAGAIAAAWQSISLPESFLTIMRRPVVLRAGAAMLAIFLVVLIRHKIPRVRPGNWVGYSLHMDKFPQAGANFLAAGRCPGLLFNDYGWGGYLIGQLYPRRLVFIDGRAEVYYKCGAYDDHEIIQFAAPGWQEKLDRWGVQVILTDKQKRLAQALHESPQWRLAFTGPIEVIYTRSVLP